MTSALGVKEPPVDSAAQYVTGNAVQTTLTTEVLETGIINGSDLGGSVGSATFTIQSK